MRLCGTACYGYSVAVDNFSSDRMAKYGISFDSDYEKCLSYDAQTIMSKCWRLFSKSFDKSRVAKSIKCLVSCTPVAGMREVTMGLDCCYFVFGYKLLTKRNSLSDVAAWPELPAKIA